MKLETTAGLLKAALNAVKHAIEKRNTIPVLAMIKIDGRTIEATNLDMWIKVDVPAKVAKGALCVPFFPLFGLIRHIDEEQTVAIAGEVEDGVTVTFGHSSYELLAAPAEDFPAFQADDMPVMEIDGAALKRALAYVAPSISTEETRYYLNGVNIEGSLAVATDGHRLAAHPLGFSVDEEKGIVPVGAIKALLALPAATGLQLDGKKCRFSVKMPGVTLSGKLIDGNYPDWRRVVPVFQNQYSELRADKTQLIEILRRLDAVDPSARTVSIAWQDDTLAAVVRGDASAAGRGFGREEMDIPVASLGGGSRFSVNIRYFISALRLINRDEVDIRMQEAGAPMVLRGDGEAFMVVMPMVRGFEESLAQAGAMLTAAAKRKLVDGSQASREGVAA